MQKCLIVICGSKHIKRGCNLSILLLKNRKEGKEMSILSGIKKVIPYFKNADGNYEQLSYKTSSQTVDFDDGKTAETKLGAIKGITTSTSVTETGYAADAKTVSEINQSLGNIPIKAVYVPARENTRIKVTIRDAHDHCLIFGETNHDPFACLITHAGCLNIIGNIDSERSELTFMLYVPNWTTATIIAPGTYDKNIIVTCD